MFEIKKIVNYLKKYKEDLEELYKWDAKYNTLFQKKLISEKEFAELENHEKLNFQKEEILKEIISKKLQDWYKNDKNKFKELALWLIREWGGIRGGTKENTIKCVYDFINDLKPNFNRIASSSKVGSFMYPDKYIIYDSRVSYSVNWILLSQDAGKKYFPIPEGRNSKMNAFDMNVLIRLKNIDKYKLSPSLNNEIPKKYISKIDSEIFINKNEAYYEMNKLIYEVNKSLWANNRKNEPFYCEMLLFSLADTVVFKEITETISY